MKISVAITTFNHARFIRQAVESVLRQQCQARVEIVVGDDCSTDGTSYVLRDLEREYRGRMKVIRPPRRLGQNGRAMFLETLRHCDGDFVAMLDGDDYWTCDEKLQKQLGFFSRHPECALCHHAVESVYEDGHTGTWNLTGWVPERLFGIESLLPWHHIGSPSPLVRGGVVRKLPRWIERSPFGDWPLYLAAADQGSIGYLAEPLAAYRFHAGGVWTQASAAERQQQVVDFFGAIGGPTLRRNMRWVVGALTFHLLELAETYERDGLLKTRDGQNLSVQHHPDLKDFRDTHLVKPSARFIIAVIWFLQTVDGNFRERNPRPIARALSGHLFNLSDLLAGRGKPSKSLKTAIRALQTEPRTFAGMAAVRLKEGRPSQ